MEVRSNEKLSLIDTNIERPRDLAISAREWLNMTQEEIAQFLNLNSSTISRYESGKSSMPAGYLAFLMNRVLDDPEEEYVQGARTWRELEDNQRQLLSLTMRLLTKYRERGARIQVRTREDLRGRAEAFVAERKRRPDDNTHRANCDSTTLIELTQIVKVAAPEIQEQQERAVQSMEVEQVEQVEQVEPVEPVEPVERVEIRSAQEQAEDALSAGTLRVSGGQSRHARLKKSAMIAISLLAITIIFGTASFLLTRNQGQTGNTAIFPEKSALNGSMSSPPGLLAVESSSPTQLAVVQAQTETPGYAPTMTPSFTPTKVAVATRTPTMPASQRTGAVCYDGTYSCSTGSGACSRHDGVSYWIYYPKYPESCP